MVHGRVANDGRAGDVRRRDTRLLRRLTGQTVQSGQNALLHFLPAPVQHILNPGNHVRAILPLWVQGAGLGQQSPGFAGEQIGNHSCCADIDGKGIGVCPVRDGLHALACGQDSGGGHLGNGHDHVFCHNSLTGQDFCPGL